jgi:hypothetical protein
MVLKYQNTTVGLAGLEENRSEDPDQHYPIGEGEKLLKPALRLMSDYRLRIDEIKGSSEEEAVQKGYLPANGTGE